MNIKTDIHKIKNKQDRLSLSHLLDQYEIHKKTGRSTSSKFLNEKELIFLENYLHHLGIPYQTKKASPDCEKSIIYFGEYEDFISIFYIRNKHLRHKDVVGSLFAVGYNHAMMGDIFLQNGVYLTNLKKYDPLLESSFTKIGKYEIELEKIECLPEIKREFDEFKFQLTSFRLDLIVSRLAHVSRAEALGYLRKNNVYVNFVQIEKPEFRLQKGDILSIEKVGKFKVKETTRLAKKGKVQIELEKYQ